MYFKSHYDHTYNYTSDHTAYWNQKETNIIANF